MAPGDVVGGDMVLPAMVRRVGRAHLPLGVAADGPDAASPLHSPRDDDIAGPTHLLGAARSSDADTAEAAAGQPTREEIMEKHMSDVCAAYEDELDMMAAERDDANAKIEEANADADALRAQLRASERAAGQRTAEAVVERRAAATELHLCISVIMLRAAASAAADAAALRTANARLEARAARLEDAADPDGSENR
eukprot:gene16753-6303_t